MRRRTWLTATAVQVAAALCLGAPAQVAAARYSHPATTGKAHGVWHPLPETTWQWQLQDRIKTTIRAHVYDIDLFDNKPRVVRALHRKGRRVVCYMSAGSWENWRRDARSFPEYVKGRSNGWPGERWLDIRKIGVLGPIMRHRLDRCAAKGFDGVEFDNVDGYSNRTGFPLTRTNQLAYNRFLASAAHHRGLAAALKNDVGQVKALEPSFDFAINEECFRYRECGRLMPFIRANKAVFNVEYDLPMSSFCPKARERRFTSMKKALRLGPWRRTCR